MASISATFIPVMETIFPPVFEHNNSQFKPVNHSDAVVDVQTELPKLVSVDSSEGRHAYTDAQSYNFWDFNDSSATISPIGDDIEFYDVITKGGRDYDHRQCDIIFDNMDQHMVLPPLERPMRITDICDDRLSVEAAIGCDLACSYLAIHHMTSNVETETNYRCCVLEDVDCFDPQFFLRNLPDYLEYDWPNLLPKETRQRKPITLVLDLDETLVHSTLKHIEDADFSFTFLLDAKLHTVYVKRRPHLQTFLKRVAQMFEVIIFTASQSIYAEQLLDILDPENNLFSHRMFRESCIFTNGDYIKDLTVLGLDLAKVAIIDNSPQVFRLQANNGIPIESWFNDPTDEALISLLPFLETLVDADDVRPIIADRFSNKQ